MEINVSIPSRGKTATLEVESDHDMNSVVEVLCEELGLGNSRRWSLACRGKAIDDSETLGELNMHDGYRIEMVEVEVGAAGHTFVKTSSDRRGFGREWKEPKNRWALKEDELKTGPKRSWREWLNEPIGGKMRPEGWQQTQRLEPSHKQSFREWLNQPIGRKGKNAQTTPTKFCYECGTRISIDSSYCDQCGTAQ